MDREKLKEEIAKLKDEYIEIYPSWEIIDKVVALFDNMPIKGVVYRDHDFETEIDLPIPTSTAGEIIKQQTEFIDGIEPGCECGECRARLKALTWNGGRIKVKTDG